MKNKWMKVDHQKLARKINMKAKSQFCKTELQWWYQMLEKWSFAKRVTKHCETLDSVPICCIPRHFNFDLHATVGVLSIRSYISRALLSIDIDAAVHFKIRNTLSRDAGGYICSLFFEMHKIQVRDRHWDVAQIIQLKKSMAESLWNEKSPQDWKRGVEFAQKIKKSYSRRLILRPAEEEHARVVTPYVPGWCVFIGAHGAMKWAGHQLSQHVPDTCGSRGSCSDEWIVHSDVSRSRGSPSCWVCCRFSRTNPLIENNRLNGLRSGEVTVCAIILKIVSQLFLFYFQFYLIFVEEKFSLVFKKNKILLQRFLGKTIDVFRLKVARNSSE